MIVSPGSAVSWFTVLTKVISGAVTRVVASSKRVPMRTWFASLYLSVAVLSRLVPSSVPTLTVTLMRMVPPRPAPTVPIVQVHRFAGEGEGAGGGEAGAG